MNIDKEYIINLIEANLKPKLIGTDHGRNVVTDVKVLIKDEDFFDENGGFSITTFEIKLMVEAPTGRAKGWVSYYL